MSPLHQFKDIYNPYATSVGNQQESLHQEAEITSTVKSVGREMATIEAEKNEVILKPDLSGIYKIKGKRHYAGGTPLTAEEGSFIFSDYNKLSIDKKDQELLELKLGGKTKQKNTPSAILQKNVDIEHYNRMINILDDPNKDIIAKRSSQLMLDKYQKTLGRIAYAQEQKKNFKEGVPDFSNGTAPVKDEDMQNMIDEQDQYKGGGMVNPYLPKAQAGTMGKWNYNVRTVKNADGSKTVFFNDGKYETTFPNGRLKRGSLRNDDFQMFDVSPNQVEEANTDEQGNITYGYRDGDRTTYFNNGRYGSERKNGRVTVGEGNIDSESLVYDKEFSRPVTANSAGQVVTPPSTNTATNTTGINPYAGGNTKEGRFTPTGVDNKFAFEGDLEGYKKVWKEAGLDLDQYKTNAEAQAAVYDHLSKTPEGQQQIIKMWKNNGMTKKGMNSVISRGIPGKSKMDATGKIYDGVFDDPTTNVTDTLGLFKQGYVDNLFGVRTLVPEAKPAGVIPPAPVVVPPAKVPDTPTILNPKVENNRYLPYEPNVKKTLPMIIDESIAGYNYASVKRNDPTRFQVKTPGIELNYLNAQGALNSVNQSVNEAYNATRGLNPYQAQASMNEIFGKSLAAKADINFKYDSDNRSTGNQQNTANQGVQRSDMMFNVAADEKFTNQTTLANVHYDNAKGVALNAWRAIDNKNQGKIDDLYNALAQQPIAGSEPVLDRKGNQVYDTNGKALMRSKPLYDVIPGTNRTYNTGVGNILNSAASGSSTANLMSEYAQAQKDFSTATDKDQRRTAAYNLANIRNLIYKQQKKSGGFVRNPYN